MVRCMSSATNEAKSLIHSMRQSTVPVDSYWKEKLELMWYKLRITKAISIISISLAESTKEIAKTYPLVFEFTCKESLQINCRNLIWTLF
jgi:hypothetical protein